MPGLITHQRIFFESVTSLKKLKHPDHSTHLLDVQFSHPLFMSSALSGLLIPNLFDYLPGKRNIFFGNSIKHFLHSDDGASVIFAMLNTLLNNANHEPNEWVYYQKGFFYGYISHWVADAIYHPFVFYWAGFPTYKDNRVSYYRNQHLLFEYTIDQYMAYFYNSEPFDYNLERMVPHKNTILYKATKDIFINAIATIKPSITFKPSIIAWLKHDGYDIALQCVKPVYSLKKTRNAHLIKILRFLEKRAYSDFLVRYPDARKINRHILNLHRDRWFNPSGEVGLHYESVDDLFRIVKEKTVTLWKQFEELLNLKEMVSPSQFNAVIEFANAYTGKKGFSLDGMIHQNPIRLRN